jgi:RNA polymerase sigma-70 factor (ECF subfamily)
VIRHNAPERRREVSTVVAAREPETEETEGNEPRRPLEGRDAWEVDARERLTAGDETGLADIYDQYASFVFGLAKRVIGDPRAAEDVSQEVFLHLWEHPEAFDPERGSMRTWLGTLTHRRSVDHVRREEARRRRALREASRRTVPVPDIDEMAAAMITAERVRAALDVLPSEQRACIDLAYFGGLTYRQVAERLAIPEGTAKSRLRLALGRIADALEAEGLERWA